MFVRGCDTGFLTAICFAVPNRLGVPANFAAFYQGFATESVAKHNERVDETSTSNPQKVLSATILFNLKTPT